MNFLLDFIIKVSYTRKEIVKMFIIYNFNFHYILWFFICILYIYSFIINNNNFIN